MKPLASSNSTPLFQTLHAASSCTSSNTSPASPQRQQQQRAQFLELSRALKMPHSFPNSSVAPNSHESEQSLLQHYHHGAPKQQQQEGEMEQPVHRVVVAKFNETTSQAAGMRRTTTPANYAASLAGILSSPPKHHQQQDHRHHHHHHSACSAENILGITKEALRIAEERGMLSSSTTDDASSTSSSSSGSMCSASASHRPRLLPPPSQPMASSSPSSLVPAQTHPPVGTTAQATFPTTSPFATTALLSSPAKSVGYVPAGILPPALQQQPHGLRLNKFVRRLHDMLQAEKDSGVVEWRRGLLVLHSTDIFSKKILSKYFNTRNFKTFRRQLNYYGFVHVRSFTSTTIGSSTTALWVNQLLAQSKVQYTAEGRPVDTADIAAVLLLKRVEPCDAAKTAEGRRARKELAIHTVEDDLGVSARTLQMEQIRSLAFLQPPPRYEEDNDPVPFHPHQHHLFNTNENIKSHEQEAMDVDDTDLPRTSPCPAADAAVTTTTPVTSTTDTQGVLSPVPSLLPHLPTSFHGRRSYSLAEGSVGAVSLSSESSMETSNNSATSTSTMCVEPCAQQQPRISRTMYYHHLYSRAAAAAAAGTTITMQQDQDDDDHDEFSCDIMANASSWSVPLPPKQENASAANLLLLLSKSG